MNKAITVHTPDRQQQMVALAVVCHASIDRDAALKYGYTDPVGVYHGPFDEWDTAYAHAMLAYQSLGGTADVSR